MIKIDIKSIKTSSLGIVEDFRNTFFHSFNVFYRRCPIAHRPALSLNVLNLESAGRRRTSSRKKKKDGSVSVRPTTCRNYLLIVKAWKQRTKIRMGRLPFSHVRMNYFWWAKTERIVVYSAVNLLFRNNKIQLSKCHYITIFMNCKISLTYISETHWKQSIKFQIESMFHFPFS